MKQFDVITVGNAVIDEFLTIHDATSHARLDSDNYVCFPHGEKITLDSIEFHVGGNACNVSVGLSRLGLSSALVAELGSDEFVGRIYQTLENEKVDTSFLIQTPNTQSSFAVGLNFQAERTLFTQHFVRKHAFLFDDCSAKLVYLTSLGEEWRQAYQKAVDFSKQSHSLLAFNPGSHQLDDGYEAFAPFFQVSDMVFLNKEEAIEIAKANSLSFGEISTDQINQLLEAVQKLGPKTVIITDGRKGSYALDHEGKTYKEACFPGDPIERTGAGDAYATGFLGAFLKGKPIQQAMLWGAINAASVVQKMGAQAGLLREEEIEKSGQNKHISQV